MIQMGQLLLAKRDRAEVFGVQLYRTCRVSSVAHTAYGPRSGMEKEIKVNTVPDVLKLGAGYRLFVTGEITQILSSGVSSDTVTTLGRRGGTPLRCTRGETPPLPLPTLQLPAVLLYEHACCSILPLKHKHTVKNYDRNPRPGQFRAERNLRLIITAGRPLIKWTFFPLWAMTAPCWETLGRPGLCFYESRLMYVKYYAFSHFSQRFSTDSSKQRNLQHFTENCFSKCPPAEFWCNLMVKVPTAKHT